MEHKTKAEIQTAAAGELRARAATANRRAAVVEERPAPGGTPGGMYRRELVRCGKERCKRCAEGPSHGPYWYHYFYRNGKRTSRYVGKELGAPRSSARDEQERAAWRAAWKLLEGHRGRLEAAGLDPAALGGFFEGGGRGARPPGRVRVSKGGGFAVEFPYDENLVEEIREVPGGRFSYQKMAWYFPATAAAAVGLLGFAFRHGFASFGLDAGVVSRAAEILDDHERKVAASHATDASFFVEGLGGELEPYQRAGVAYAVRAKRTFMADEQGVGKTMEALATVEALRACPAVVVCPAGLKGKWRSDAERWLPGRSVAVLGGLRRRRAPRADVVIVNYEVLGRHVDRIKARRGRSAVRALILDESHYAKSEKAARTRSAMRLAEGVPVRLLVTGTPVRNRPFELVSQLSILDRLGDLGGFWNFVRRYCDACDTGHGWDFSGASNLDELNDELRALCYVRRTKARVLPDLAPKTAAVVPVELEPTTRREYERARCDVARYLAEQAALGRMFGDTSNAETPVSFSGRRDQALHLRKISLLKQLSASGKLGAVKRWTGDFLESGKKLVVFAYHVEVVETLAEYFGAPSITGNTKPEARKGLVDRFQWDPDVPLIVANLQAGGEGHDLFAASDVAFAELGWTPAAHRQAEDRLHRYGQKGVVRAWYLLAEGTIDEEIYRLISEKRAVVDAATEGAAVLAGAAAGSGDARSVLPDLIEALRAAPTDHSRYSSA